MTDATAITGEYSDLKFVKTRSACQMIIEFPIEQGAEVVRMFGAPMPGAPVPVAVARLNLKGGEAKSTTALDPDLINAKLRQSASSSGGIDHSQRHWRDMKPSQQAGIRCNEPAFWKYLSDDGSGSTLMNDEGELINSASKAANYVRMICGVKSRAELDTDSRARIVWNDLDEKYLAWLAVA